MPNLIPQPSNAEGPLSIAKGLTNALLMAAQGMPAGLLCNEQAEWALMQIAFAIRDQIDKAADVLDIDIGA